jgi:hypothetical protein
MDDDLRNGLWNVCLTEVFQQLSDDTYSVKSHLLMGPVCRAIWSDFFKQPVDEIPELSTRVFEELKKFYVGCDWSTAYDFVEFIAGLLSDDYAPSFVSQCNAVLEREMSAYRFVGTQLTRITNAEELAAVESALKLPSDPVRNHIETAVALFADRKTPDYRNSIKESISAVEAICKILTGEEKATLNVALKKLESAGIPVHQSLKQAFDKLYAYSGDADGIRHALLDEPTLDFDDAKFMLVSCSAFVNYLAAKAAKAGVVAAGK